MNLRFVAGLVLGFLVGFGCAVSGIPAPAPPALAGALLVLAMSVGYVLADRWTTRRAASRAHGGGPSGRPTGDGA
jgi:XapX domain-containing protein